MGTTTGTELDDCPSTVSPAGAVCEDDAVDDVVEKMMVEVLVVKLVAETGPEI